MAVKWEKCAFFQNEEEWLGFKISNLGVKPLVGKIRFDKKPTKSQKHFRTKVVLWVNQSVNEIRPELVISKFSLTTTSRKKISLPMERRAYEGV